MTVGELIALLRKCPEDSLVMYDAEVECDNEALTIMQAETWEKYTEYSMGIDDVMIGGGTSKGFVYLTAEPYPE